MALAQPPKKEVLNEQTPPKARDDLYRSAVVDEQYNSQLGLENYASGYYVEVEYYEQILGRDDEQASLQVTRDGAQQQYRRIVRLPIKLQSGMQAVYDPENRRFSQEGVFTSPALFIPKVGDVILLTGLNHEIAVYSVGRVQPKNLSVGAAYECEFAFQGLLNATRLANLTEKTVDTAVYDADQLKHGKNPVLATTAYNRKYDYLRAALELCQVYYTEFYNREINTLLIPDQGLAMYDPWCVRAFSRIWGALEGKETRRFMQLNVDDSQHADAKSVFELVMDKNARMESQLTVEFQLVHYKEFFPYPQPGGVRFSGVKGVMWPVYGFQAYYDLKPSKPRIEPRNPFAQHNTADELTGEQQRLFPSVTEDEYYVFTKAFYANTPDQSVLEGLVRTLIEEGRVSQPILMDLVEELPRLGAVERYYFTPFVIMLLRAGALEP